jgi:hypothetical protein
MSQVNPIFERFFAVFSKREDDIRATALSIVSSNTKTFIYNIYIKYTIIY